MALTGRSRNVVMAWQNFVDETTTVLTSPTSFVANFPLTNVKNDRLRKVARSTGSSMVFDLDFGQAVPVTALAVLGHNLTERAAWRIRFASSRSGAASDPGGYTFPLANTVYDSRGALKSSTAVGALVTTANLLDHDFTTKTLPAGSSFSRSSPGTYFDFTGTLRTAASDEPRFDYDHASKVARGLLVEEGRTNLLLYSLADSDLPGWLLGANTIRVGSTVVPDGTAAAVYRNSSTSSAYISRTYTLAANTTYTVSCYSKRVSGTGTTGSIISAEYHDGSTSQRAAVSMGSVPADGSVVRLSVTFTNVTAGTYSAYFYADTGTVGDVAIWNVQCEVGSSPTSYIPTTSTSVDRTIDVPTLPTSALPFNAVAGTLITKFISSRQSTGRQTISGIYDESGNKAEISRNGVSVARATSGISYSWMEAAGETGTATIATNFNTGWQLGDIRGAYLCDTATGSVGAASAILNVTDGSTAGWGVRNSGVLSTVAGRLRVTNVAGTNGGALRSLTTVPGSRYRVAATAANSVSGTATITVGTSAPAADLGTWTVTGTSGSFSFEFTATTSTTWITLFCVPIDGAYTDFDDIRVEDLAPNLVTNGDFGAGATGWTLESGWAISGGMATKTPGTGSHLAQTLSAPLITGQSYVLSFTVSGYTAGSLSPTLIAGSSNQISPAGPLVSLTANGTYHFQFTATASQDRLLIFASPIFAGNVDNVSLRLALPDRSYKGKGLVVNGTLGRTALPCGLAYLSGFNSTAYLWQPYNLDLEFGTTDWSYDFWLSNSTIPPSFDRIFDRGLPGLASGAHIRALVSSGQLLLFASDGTNTATATTSAPTWGSGIWRHVVFCRRSGALEIWVDGVLKATQVAGSVGSLNCAGAELRIGAGLSGAAAWSGGMVMAGVSAYAPTPAQIRKKYEDERALIVGGTPATLGGSSNAVTGLTRSTNGDVSVVTSSGVSVMYRLGRQSYSAGAGSSNSTQAVSGFEEFQFEIGGSASSAVLTARDQSVPGSAVIVGAAFGDGAAKLCASGGDVATAAASIPTWGTTSLRLGSNASGANGANAPLATQSYIGSQASNTDLQILTNPDTTTATRSATLAPYAGTSGTAAIVLGTGSKTVYVYDEDMRFYPGSMVRLSIDNANYMSGTVTSHDYAQRKLVVNITSVVGSGSASSMAVTRLDTDITVWPDVTPFAEGGYWGQFTWGGLLSLVGRDYKPPGIHLPALATGNDEPIFARYCKIEISDSSLSYIDVGRMFVSAAYQPSRNLEYDWYVAQVDPSPKERSRGGQVYADGRPQYRRIELRISGIDRNEIMSQVYEMQRELGVRRPFLLIVDPTDPVNLHRLTLYGSRPDEAAPISNPLTENYYAVTIVVEEWL